MDDQAMDDQTDNASNLPPLPEPARRQPWQRGIGALVLVTFVGLAVFAVWAESGRREQGRKAGDLAGQAAELRRQQETLSARLGEAERQLAAEQARFRAVEPCLRQVTTPQPVPTLSEADLRRIIADAQQVPAGAPTFRVVPGSALAPKEFLPACRDVDKQLR